VAQVLVGVDDHMLRALLTLRYQGLSDRQGRTAIGETDLDHHLRVLCDQQVAKSITVLAGKRHPLEVTVGSDVLRADLGEPAPHILDRCQKVTVNRHC
jgi:hypothetical protein